MEASMLVLNYLLGGFFTGYWIIRLKDGRDLRTLGSGTMANDAVAGQLSLLKSKGIIPLNGEFDLRLNEHARRWDLDFDVIPSPYGEPLDYERLEETANSGGYGWMWAVHGETSTGVLNDLDRLKQISSRHGLLLALDCVISFGAVPFQLVRPRL